MNSYTEKDIITTQREVIQELRIERDKQENIINAQAQDIYKLGQAMQRYELIQRRLKEQLNGALARMEKLELAIADMAKEQKLNTAGRKKFEAGYWKGVGE